MRNIKNHQLSRMTAGTITAVLCLLFTCCSTYTPIPLQHQPSAGVPPQELAKFHIIADIATHTQSPFYIDFKHYPAKDQRKALAIGVFDSGTGGLTVLDAIITMDRNDNHTGQSGADGIPDFAAEHFVYLGDSANMPYGTYDSEGQGDFLKELIIQDVRFLLGSTYYQEPTDTQPQADKEPVKTIVIACNTATAAGGDLLRQAMHYWGIEVEILGIIDAGTRAAVAVIPPHHQGKDQITGIMATEGTCASMGYPRSLEEQFYRRFGHHDCASIQQPGFGLAAAIDGSSDFIDPNAGQVRGSEKYRGPRLDHPQFPIDLELWGAYQFNPAGLLVKKDEEGRIVQVELNSVENYIKYHVTHLVVQAARLYPDRELSTVILGCTHYPYFTAEIERHFHYLDEYDAIYERIIPSRISLVDPAQSLAVELYEYLAGHKLLAAPPNPGQTAPRHSRFFITAANPLLAGNQLDAEGNFTYAYKYSRPINSGLEYVKHVPLTRTRLSPDVLDRIEEKMPGIFRIMFTSNDYTSAALPYAASNNEYGMKE